MCSLKRECDILCKAAEQTLAAAIQLQCIAFPLLSGVLPCETLRTGWTFLAIYHFSCFVFNDKNLSLKRDDRPQAINLKTAELLSFLLASRGCAVSLSALVAGTWAKTLVETQSVHDVILDLKKTLGCPLESPLFIRYRAEQFVDWYFSPVIVYDDSDFNSAEKDSEEELDSILNQFPASLEEDDHTVKASEDLPRVNFLVWYPPISALFLLLVLFGGHLLNRPAVAIERKELRQVIFKPVSCLIEDPHLDWVEFGFHPLVIALTQPEWSVAKGLQFDALLSSSHSGEKQVQQLLQVSSLRVIVTSELKKEGSDFVLVSFFSDRSGLLHSQKFVGSSPVECSLLMADSLSLMFLEDARAKRTPKEIFGEVRAAQSVGNGMRALEENRLESACFHLEGALILKPKLVTYRANYAMALARTGKMKSAFGFANDALQIASLSGNEFQLREALVSAATVASLGGQIEHAQIFSQQLLTLNKDEHSSYWIRDAVRLADIQVRKGSLGQAEKLLLQCLLQTKSRDDGDNGRVNFCLGNLARAKSQWKTAGYYYERAYDQLVRAQEQEEALIVLFALYQMNMRTGHFKVARSLKSQLLVKSERLRSIQIQELLGLGATFLDMGLNEEALWAFEETNKRIDLFLDDPIKNIELSYGLATSYLRLGRPQQGLNFYHTCVSWFFDLPFEESYLAIHVPDLISLRDGYRESQENRFEDNRFEQRRNGTNEPAYSSVLDSASWMGADLMNVNRI